MGASDGSVRPNGDAGIAGRHDPIPDEFLSVYWRKRAEQVIARTPEGWFGMVDALAAVQEAAAGSLPPPDVVREVTSLLARARECLAPHEVTDEDVVFGRMMNRPSRGQTFSPPLWIARSNEDELVGSTYFGRFHGGVNGAVHGGAIALVFDEALGRLADGGERARSRTASLTVDYRSIAPVGTVLRVHGSIREEHGRKRYVCATLWDGDRLCAEANALFLGLRPGQP